MVRCFLFRLGRHFLMFDRERTVVRGHFPVMLSRNRVRRLFGPLVEHSGTLNQIFGVRHGDTSLPTNLCKPSAGAGRSVGLQMNVWTACRDGGWRGSEGHLGAASWLFNAVAVNLPDRTALGACQFHSPPADEDVQHHDRTGPHRPEPALY